LARSSSPVPYRLWVIALLGLSPFPAAAAIYAFGPSALNATALILLFTYSASVQAFLGGVRWGLEAAREHPRGERLALSVLAPVVAWMLVFTSGLMPTTWALGGLIATFLLQWLFDEHAPDVASRYPSLGTVVALGACVSLAVALERALRL
jgi:hypothetical protein